MADFLGDEYISVGRNVYVPDRTVNYYGRGAFIESNVTFRVPFKVPELARVLAGATFKRGPSGPLPKCSVLDSDADGNVVVVEREELPGTMHKKVVSLRDVLASYVDASGLWTRSDINEKERAGLVALIVGRDWRQEDPLAVLKHSKAFQDGDNALRYGMAWLHIIARSGTDISRHMETLFNYARKSRSVLELGSRQSLSTVALACGLADQDCPNRRLDVVDLDPIDSAFVPIVEAVCRFNEVECNLHPKTNDLAFPVQERSWDMVFIDSLHCYGQLRRELHRYAPHVRKYIALHDTVSWGERGEGPSLLRTYKVSREAMAASITQAYPAMGPCAPEELDEGLCKAVDEFLAARPDEWVVDYSTPFGHGLMVLKRVGGAADAASGAADAASGDCCPSVVATGAGAGGGEDH